MAAQLRREAEIGGYEAVAEARDAITATYDAIARLIGGRSDEVALFWACRPPAVSWYQVPTMIGM
jgi:cysteine desulfurase/selenocysteine lyase